MDIKLLQSKVNYKIKQSKNEFIDNLCQTRLLLSKGIQKKKFARLSSQCWNYYKGLSLIKDESGFITPAWIDYNRKMEELISPQPNFSFLRHPEILATMFLADDGAFIQGELKFCEKNINWEQLRKLLEEDYVGTPIIRNYKYLTSHNRIHHLYHLVKFQQKTGVNLSNLKQVIEWGGGYGDMARLMQRINSEVTYIIIDTPLFCCVQWLYLASIMGEEKVNLIQSYEDGIKNSKINIIPLVYVHRFQLKADTFIATWSLSESSEYALEYVRSKNFFDAEHLLLAYQRSSEYFPSADNLAKIASVYGASIENFEFLPENYYAFK